MANNKTEHVKKSVVLGLSGGVDSAVAARILLDRGYRVEGVHLSAGACCPSASEDAKRVAERLQIPFTVESIEEELETRVIAPFVESYLAGRTPNPCVLCNRTVKFPALFRAAKRLGCEYAATGHYARADCTGGHPALKTGPFGNDQSYMLSRLEAWMLPKLMFPLGETAKPEVRDIARRLALPPADKPDSMEICFIPGNDHAAFIEARRGTLSPGDFVDETGNILGRHEGIARYTVGMRRGLGIPSASRLYVKALRPEKNEVVLAEEEAMYVSEISIEEVRFLSGPPLFGPFKARARVRHSRGFEEAEAEISGDGGEIRFFPPIRRPAPGQAAALYLEDVLYASGIIR